MIQLLVMAPCGDAMKQRFRDECQHQYSIRFINKEDEKIEEAIKEAEVIIGEPPLGLLSQAHNLKWLQMTWAGTNMYTSQKGFPKYVTLTNASGAYGAIISEYIIGSILMQYRRFPQYLGNQKQAVWKDMGRERTLQGKKVLILGTGDIGSNTAKRLHIFGTTNMGIRRTIGSPVDGFDKIYTLEHLDELLPDMDLVIGCLPETCSTKGLFHKGRLLRMKEDALLINVGRGSLIVTEDLVDVLQTGHLSGAVLDVVSPEPLPEESPLWKMDRVMVTPHISGVGFHHEPDTEERIWNLCMENLHRYDEGKKLLNRVDIEAGY